MIRDTWNLTEPLVPVNIPAVVVRVGAGQGLSVERMLEKTQIHPTQLTDPTSRLTYQQFITLIDNLNKHYPSETLGLDIGCAININQLGMLGYAILSCSTLREALELGLKYHALVDPAFMFEVVDDEQQTAIRLISHVPSSNMYRIMCDVFIGLFLTLARFLTGDSRFQANAVHLNHPEPSYAKAYVPVALCPVLFDQPRTEILFSTQALAHPLAMADQATAAMAEQQCAEILQRLGTREGVVAKVRRVLLSHPGVFLGADDVARQLATSTRTLSRCLQEVGTSYQRVLDEVRKEIAIEYLQRSRLPVEEIAELIGYSDPSNFRKAFRRWTNHPPSYYRRVE